MPATSNFGVNCPQALRFHGLFDQSEKTSAGFAAGAGIAKRFGEAGAMRKSLAGTALVDSVVLLLLAVLTSFCCAESGRAIRAPIATITLHLRIVSSIIETKNPVSSPSSISAKTPDGDAGQYAANHLLLQNGGGFTPVLLTMEAVAK
jgi:hypothetical protein